ITLEPPRQRPRPARRRHAQLRHRRQMPLAHAVGVVAILHQHLGEHPVLRRNHRVGPRETGGEIHHAGHTVQMMVPPRQQRRPGRRAHRRRVPLRVTQPHLRDPGQVRRLDQPAEGVPGRDPRVVPEHEEHVGRTRPRLRRQVGRPVLLRVSDVQVDDPAELLRHGVSFPHQGPRMASRELVMMSVPSTRNSGIVIAGPFSASHSFSRPSAAAPALVNRSTATSTIPTDPTAAKTTQARTVLVNPSFASATTTPAVAPSGRLFGFAIVASVSPARPAWYDLRSSTASIHGGSSFRSRFRYSLRASQNSTSPRITFSQCTKIGVPPAPIPTRLSTNVRISTPTNHPTAYAGAF